MMTRRGRAMAPTSDTTGAETLFAISAEAARGTGLSGTWRSGTLPFISSETGTNVEERNNCKFDRING
jgi:hypothetical protein